MNYIAGSYLKAQSFLDQRFSGDQFSFNDPTKGNEVIFTHTVTGHILGCDIVTTDTNKERILCETQASPTGDADYSVKVKVDGKWLNDDPTGSKRTFCLGTCIYRYRDYYTPTITKVEPQSGLPGDVIKINGKLQTIQISRLSIEFDPDRPEISKTFLGNEICEPFDSSTNELIGAELTNCEVTGGAWCRGWYKCTPASKVVGSWNVSYIVSNTGRSRRQKESYLVDANDQSYVYQTYADISSVWPKEGSKSGGTLLTIKGKFLTNDKSHVSVTVGGVPCKVVTTSKTEVTCVTGKQAVMARNSSDPYPGGRGASMDLWKSSGVRSFSSFLSFDKNSSIYSRHIMRDTLEFNNVRFPSSEKSHGRFSGFFVPPHTGYYTFFVSNDDVGQIYMSDNELASQKKLIASCPSYSYKSFYRFASQMSVKKRLAKHQPYYFEFPFFDYGGGYYARMAVKMDKTERTASQVSGGINEKQSIRINSIYKVEKQVLSLSSLSSSLTFKLEYGGRVSNVINTNADASTVKAELQKMFSWQCNYYPDKSNAYVFQGFEGKQEGNDYGTRVTSTLPHCGRFSLKVDVSERYLFVEKVTKVNGVTKKKYSPKVHRKLCFAYKGPLSSLITIRAYFTNTDGKQVQATRSYNFVRASNLLKWNHACMDVYDMISKDSYYTKRVGKSPNYYVKYIRVNKDGVSNVDMLVDDIWIGSRQATVTRTLPGAQPDGAIIETFDVTQPSNGTWQISMKPADCFENLGLIRINNLTGISNGTSFTTYALSSSVLMNVSRIQKTSPPVKGTFDVTWDGKSIKNIKPDIVANDLKSLLTTELSTGELAVIRDGTCAGYEWTIEWTGIGGNKPLIQVSGKSLTGDNVTILSSTITEGGILLGSIPAEFLQTPEPLPPVVVTINDIVSACINNNCSYQYLESRTPKLASVRPSAGQGGPAGTCTVVTISGTGFSTNIADNNVTIGNVSCDAQRSNETSITCCPGYSQAGTHAVNVHVGGKGNAEVIGDINKFKYNIVVGSLSPAKGSLSGGTEVTILGNGFGHTSKDCIILFGDARCIVRSINMSIIVCVTAGHVASNVTVNVTIVDESALLLNAYEYSASVTPMVTAVSMDWLSVVEVNC
eukprot:gene6708-7470_t